MKRRVYVCCLVFFLSVIEVAFIAFIATPITQPFQIDYGEGIVLYQATKVMHLASAYKPINQYPYVVFHYPPVYHLAVVAVGKWTGDLLSAGRSVSVASFILIQVIFGLLVFFCLPRRLDRFCRYGTALFAAFLPSILNVMYWARLARVDMLALFLSFAGIAVFVLGGTRKWTPYVAFALFVCAVYTKQTMVAAPLACFVVMLAVDAKNAIKVAAFAGLLGTGVLISLSLATGGEVLKHLFLYNQNTFSIRYFRVLVLSDYSQIMPIFVLAVSAAAAAGTEAWRLLTQKQWQRIRFLLERSAPRRLVIVCSLLMLFGLLISISAVKTGANYNYFLEWNLACCPLAAVALCRIMLAPNLRSRWTPSTFLLFVFPLAFLLPKLLDSTNELRGLVMNAVQHSAVNTSEEYQTYSDALAVVQKSPGPVFSEDMLLLVRTGKEVPAEPAIIRELARTSKWDERPFIRMIEEKRFSTILTTSEDIKDSNRYTPAVAEAIDGAYQETRRIGTKYKIYEPRTN